MGYGHGTSSRTVRIQKVRKKMPAFTNFTNAPTNLTPKRFMGILDAYGSIAKSCRFIVVIKPTGRLSRTLTPLVEDLAYLCEVAEMPARGFETISNLRYYGPKFALPLNTSYANEGGLTLSFLCRSGTPERLFFDNWMSMINPTDTYDFHYRDDYAAEIDVYQYAEFEETKKSKKSVPQYCITFMDAWPSMVDKQPLTMNDEQIQNLYVQFSYSKWLRKGVDPVRSQLNSAGYNFNLVEGASNTRENRNTWK